MIILDRAGSSPALGTLFIKDYNMVKYNLEHLTQNSNQEVGGPIQDDEALLLFSIIKTCRIKNILEVGGLDGYSAKNFISAIDKIGIVITVDINNVKKISENHLVIQKNINDITIEDIKNISLDLVFFDCHQYDAQMNFLDNMIKCGVINDNTILAFHDTNLHPKKTCPWAYYIENEGWVHVECERKMVNEVVNKYNYHVINFHTKMSDHNDDLPSRHGISIAKKFKKLII